MTVVTLYTKPGCHLCDAVEQVIAQARRHHPFDLVLRNILDDPADLARYQNDVPVVCVNGVEIARHRLERTELERALASQVEMRL
jgi:glutaredoxin